jgi:hypothetical protein
MPERRTPTFSAEVVDLFVELEHGTQRGAAFEEKSHRLARMLNLIPEFWTINSVLDGSHGPSHGPDYIAHQDWHKCRAVRMALLDAVAGRAKAG